MSNIVGFKDAKNFHIKNGSAYYITVGETYLTKFLNGLRLEDKFEKDDAFQDIIISGVNVERDNFQKLLIPPQHKLVKTYDDTELFRDDGYKVSLRKSRFTKKMRNLKKRENKNTKKNKIRQNGYDDKMKQIILSLPPIIPVSNTHPSFNYDDWDEYYILGYNSYEDTSDYYNKDDEEYDEEYEEELSYQRAIDYFTSIH